MYIETFAYNIIDIQKKEQFLLLFLYCYVNFSISNPIDTALNQPSRYL